MIDIGANLASSSFSNDLDDVLDRAKRAGIEKIIVTGSCFESNHTSLQLAHQHRNFLYSTAGLHPHHANQWNKEVEIQIKSLINDELVVAIGEAGLDYNRNFSEPEQQRRVFTEILEIASKSSKPLFLHQRDAHSDFYGLLRAYQSVCTRSVVHCFTDTENSLRAFLDLGCYIGITGWLCDKNRGENLRDIVRYIPLDRLLIESDAPYLMPHRDKLKRTMAQKNRNEPHTLGHVVKQLAMSLGTTDKAIVDATTQNAITLFNLND